MEITGAISKELRDWIADGPQQDALALIVMKVNELSPAQLLKNDQVTCERENGF